MELITQVSCEIEEVLAHTKKELVKKIPNNIREFFIKNSKDVTDYNAKYNPDISLDEQDLLEETKGILTLFYRDYWCTPEERLELETKLDENEKKYQEELRNKYNPDIFEKDKVIKEKATVPAIVVELKWYERFFQKIKKFFF